MVWHLALFLDRRHALLPGKHVFKMAETDKEVMPSLLTAPQKQHRCYKHI
jgi:hypothetical protein